MRAQLDTDVLISGILARGAARSLLERAIRGELDLVTDPAQLDELGAVLTDGLRVPPELAHLIRRELEGLADVVVARLSPTAGPPASPRSASPSRRASSGSS